MLQCYTIKSGGDIEMAGTYTERKKQYDLKYAKEHKKRIPFDVRREYYENVLSRLPEVSGIGVNTFIKAAITEKIIRDGLDLPIDQYKP